MRHETIQLGQYIIQFYLTSDTDHDMISVLSKLEKLNNLDETTIVEELSRLGCVGISISSLNS